MLRALILTRLLRVGVSNAHRPRWATPPTAAGAPSSRPPATRGELYLILVKHQHTSVSRMWRYHGFVWLRAAL